MAETKHPRTRVFTVVDEMPAVRARSTSLDGVIDKVKEIPNTPVLIIEFDDRTAAAANLNNTRRRYGPVEASGLLLAVGPLPDGRPGYGLFAKYEPDQVTEEGKAAHAKWQDEDKVKKAEQARKRADKMAANGGSGKVKTKTA